MAEINVEWGKIGPSYGSDGAINPIHAFKNLI